jgi:transposase
VGQFLMPVLPISGSVSHDIQQLGIPLQTLHNWKTRSKAGKLSGTTDYNPDLTAVLEENKRLKRALALAEMEREILKKATAYFAKDSMQSTRS